MRQMGWFWLRRHWRGVGALLAVALGALLVVLIGAGDARGRLRFLGDASAPRAAAHDAPGLLLPRSGDPSAAQGDLADPRTSLLDAPAASVGPLDLATARARWSAAELARRQAELLAAINCAREQRGAPAVRLDPALSETAADAWLRLAHDRAWSLMDLPGSYELRGVVVLDGGVPGAAAEASEVAGPGSDAPPCAVGAFDPAALPLTSAGHVIGIAVFPPQAAWDLPSAVVLVQ